VALTPQDPHPDLGVRMRAALADALQASTAQAAAVIGSDVPDLDGPALAAVLAAVAAPAGADVAFAPSPDGGFYAVAARAVRPGMFGGEAGAGGVPWSSPGARAGAAAAARAAGLTVAAGAALAALADIDTVEACARAERESKRGRGVDSGSHVSQPSLSHPTLLTHTQDLRAWRAAAPAGHPLAPPADAALAAGAAPSPPPPSSPPTTTIAVRALLFAAAREAAGTGEAALTLPAGASAADAVAALLAAHPALAAVLPACAVAVNCEVVGPAVGGGATGSTTARAVLAGGDEVALIPPISGG